MSVDGVIEMMNDVTVKGTIDISLLPLVLEGAYTDTIKAIAKQLGINDNTLTDRELLPLIREKRGDNYARDPPSASILIREAEVDFPQASLLMDKELEILMSYKYIDTLTFYTDDQIMVTTLPFSWERLQMLKGLDSNTLWTLFQTAINVDDEVSINDMVHTLWAGEASDRLDTVMEATEDEELLYTAPGSLKRKLITMDSVDTLFFEAAQDSPTEVLLVGEYTYNGSVIIDAVKKYPPKTVGRFLTLKKSDPSKLKILTRASPGGVTDTNLKSFLLRAGIQDYRVSILGPFDINKISTYTGTQLRAFFVNAGLILEAPTSVDKETLIGMIMVDRNEHSFFIPDYNQPNIIAYGPNNRAIYSLSIEELYDIIGDGDYSSKNMRKLLIITTPNPSHQALKLRKKLRALRE